ncbi:MAG TPA: GNAT family N-acetyltransferase [Propionibacteriaceae bacterium]|nr:GNAT family N-acetyltransferase [Propionibacteriaceae bacterium]
MSARRLRPMTAADLAVLPGPCSACAFWETSLSDLATSSDHRDRIQTKLDWAEAVTDRWGYCGVMAVSNGQTIGFLTLSPAAYVRRLGAFSTTPTSSDAAVVMSARVLPEWQGKGVGKQLVQSAASLVARRDIRALEAIGSYCEGPSCMLPASWLVSVGFAVVRPHPLTPRLRMDLETTARWRPGFGAAWQRLAALVPQPSSPEPAGFEPIRRSVTDGTDASTV